MKDNTLQFAVEDLEVRRGQAPLIKDLSFELTGGQRALIVGSNGSGKTSLLRILTGLAPMAAGDVRLNNIPIRQWTFEQRAQIAYRGHQEALKLDMSAAENVQFVAALHDRAVDLAETFDELQLGSAMNRPVRYLSAGQKRRVGLAILKATGASLWLLDEPITNLDGEGRELVKRWLNRHCENGGMAVIATHNPDQLEAPHTMLVEL